MRRPIAAWRVARALATLSVACAVLAVPVAAQARSSVQLSAVVAKKKPASLVTFTGRGGTRAGAKVAIERKIGKRWTTIAHGRAGKHGRFALTWITPSRASRVTVRAKLGHTVSRSRRFRILAPKKGAKTVKVSPRTQIISPSAVQAVPAPGKPGRVTLAGGNDVAVGKIVVVGQGADSPNGFLGKVTKVDQQGGQTVVDTVPATLLQAVPEGSVDLVAKSAPGSRAVLRASPISCEGSVGASITPSVTFSAGLHFTADWSTLHGGLQSASLTATAGVDASVQAAITAAGSCSLKQRTLFTIKGPSFDGFVGPVPIVMTSNLTVFLDANASAQASLSTSADAGFAASAGVAWSKGKGFSPIGTFMPHFAFNPPTLSAGASAAVTISPTVDVLLYGVVGPEVALHTGIEFNADTTADPWWTLDIPVDVTAAITIPPLDLTSPELTIYQHSFPIADAGGPFGFTPTPPSNVATPPGRLAGGYQHSCALRSSGAVACWGANEHGQLGSAGAGSSTPVAVSGISDAAAIAAGNDHTCALRVAGGVMCWGANESGELGTSGGDSATPEAVSGISNATAIAAGATDSCALLQTRRVECWGANDQEQLGDGTPGGSSSPEMVDGITTATAIASGSFHACAVLADQTVRCWGNNADGSLGDGTSNPTDVSVAVSGIANAVAVAAGADHSCALLATGTISCWGSNGDGQLGIGALSSGSDVPVSVSGITNAVAITAGAGHTCAVLATGALDCWGANDDGQIGDGGMPMDRAVPVPVSAITNAIAVTGGLFHTCALLQTGALDCWGLGDSGQLGNGMSSTESTPVPVTGFP
jgi:alpha-tubulin suppressor-like RCC1 family protein